MKRIFLIKVNRTFYHPFSAVEVSETPTHACTFHCPSTTRVVHTPVLVVVGDIGVFHGQRVAVRSQTGQDSKKPSVHVATVGSGKGMVSIVHLLVMTRNVEDLLFLGKTLNFLFTLFLFSAALSTLHEGVESPRKLSTVES